MSNRTKNWLNALNKTEKHLDPEARAVLVREAFTAVSTVAFLRWMDKRHEDLKVTTLSPVELREACLKELEIYWPEYQAMSANSTDDRLCGELERYTQMAETMGPKEWRMETGHAQPDQIRDHGDAIAPEKNHGREMERGRQGRN